MVSAARGDSRLGKTSLVLSAQLIAAVIGIGRAKLIAITYGPEGTGLLALWVSQLQLAVVILALGQPALINKKIASHAQGRQQCAEVRRQISLILFLAAACAVVGAIVAATMGGDANAAAIVVAALGAGSLLGAMLTQAALGGLERHGTIALAGVGSHLLALIVVVCVSRTQMELTESEVYLLIASQPLAFVVVSGWVLVRTVRGTEVKWIPGAPQNGRRLSIWINTFSPQINAGIRLAATSFVATAAMLAVRYIYKFNLGETSLGLMAAAWAISINYIGMGVAAIGQVYYPRVCQMAGEPRGGQRVAREFESTLKLGGLAALPGVLLIGLCGNRILPALYSPEYAQAASIATPLLLAVPARIATALAGYTHLAFSENSNFARAEIIFNVAFVVITGLLVGRTGYSAAGWAYLVAMWFQLVWTLTWLRTSGVEHVIAPGLKFVVGTTAVLGAALVPTIG